MPVQEKENRSLDTMSAQFARLLDSSLLRRSKTTAVQAEACRLIRREMVAAGTGEPPTRLRRLATHLGVHDIVATPLAGRGQLVLRNGSLVVEVSEDLDELNQRITTAHELAHIVLERERVSLSHAANVKISGDGSHRLIESLCDYCAQEILLPRWWVEDQFLQSGRRFAGAVAIAQLSRLPLEFVVTRIIGLQFVSWRAIWFARSGNAVRATRSIPHWDDYFLAGVEVVDDAESPLNECWNSKEPVAGTLTLQIHGDVSSFRAQCFSTDSTTAVSVIQTIKG